MAIFKIISGLITGDIRLLFLSGQMYIVQYSITDDRRYHRFKIQHSNLNIFKDYSIVLDKEKSWLSALICLKYLLKKYKA